MLANIISLPDLLFLMGSFAVVPVGFRVLLGAEEFSKRIWDKSAVGGMIFLTIFVVRVYVRIAL